MSRHREFRTPMTTHRIFCSISQAEDRVRAAFNAIMDAVVADTLPGREQSMAKTKIQEAYMWASAALQVRADLVARTPIDAAASET